MKKNVIFIFLILNLIHAGGVGTTAANYLKIGTGARATAMANTYVGLANDISSVYWNPAGIAEIKKSELGFTNLNYLVGISSKTFSGIMPIDENNFFGGYYTNLATPEDDETRFSEGGLAYTETGDKFKSAINIISLSYAKIWRNDLSFGSTIKLLDENLASEKSNGLVIDFGMLQHNFFIKNLNFGAVMKNFGIKKLRENEKYPFALAAGVSYQTKFFDNQLFLLADLELPNDNSPRLGFGSEYWINMIAARIGYSNYNGFTLGVGLALDALKADYAYVPYGELGTTHRISISYMLNNNTKKEQQDNHQKWEEKIREKSTTTQMVEETTIDNQPVINDLFNQITGEETTVNEQQLQKELDVEIELISD